MSISKVKDIASEIIKMGVGQDCDEVMLSLAIAVASIMKASYTPEIHDAKLGVFVDNVRHALKQMDTRQQH